MIPILIVLVIVEGLLILVLSACCRVMARDQIGLLQVIDDLYRERAA